MIKKSKYIQRFAFSQGLWDTDRYINIHMEIFLLILCLVIVLAFEFVNGMNDTANAIAPVIYSHSLDPKKSVIIAAVLNFFWVLLWGTAVAMSILHLLPLGIIANQSSTFGVILVVSILISAILWDLGAWWLALPVSSSHALIGSILGVSVAVMYSDAGIGFTPHWNKAQEVIIGLLISPLIGFALALTLIYIAHRILQKKAYFKAPTWSWDHPNLTMRTILIISSGLVSFMHGKNDGQKWVGIATLILVTLVPWSFAINPNFDKVALEKTVSAIESQIQSVNMNSLSQGDAKNATIIKEKTLTLKKTLKKEVPDKLDIRKDILAIQESYANLGLIKQWTIIPSVNAQNESIFAFMNMKAHISELNPATDYVPWWIIALVSVAIGSGTMIGWKRIVKTIGEKIGKHKMNYAQAASSALVTATTIGLASGLGLPVSTTHVMSSSVAGTMVEEHGWKNWVDPHMIKHILLAWVLTMPVTLILAGSIFFMMRALFL